MPTWENPDAEKAFLALAQIVYAGNSYEAVYAAICECAVRAIDHCDHASLMLKKRGTTYTAAATDDIALRVDQLEQEVGEGPCVDAIEDKAAHYDADLTDGSPWPALTQRILAETPVRGMAGFRIVLEGAKVGALNVFSDTAGALDEDSMDQAALLTAFASVALTAVERGEEATTLRGGLESNREIGKAIGLLMALHDISDDEAFSMLSKVSQDMNQKLAVVARRVVEQHRGPENAKTAAAND